MAFILGVWMWGRNLWKVNSLYMGLMGDISKQAGYISIREQDISRGVGYISIRGRNISRGGGYISIRGQDISN